jgi:hypothetical protein
MLSAREISANPAVAVDSRDKYGLLADLGADASEGSAAYYPIFPKWFSFQPEISHSAPFWRLPIHDDLQGT